MGLETFEYNGEVGAGISGNVAFYTPPSPSSCRREAQVDDDLAYFLGAKAETDLEPEQGDGGGTDEVSDDTDLDRTFELIFETFTSLTSRIEALESASARIQERLEEGMGGEGEGEPPSSTEEWQAWLWQLPLSVILAFVLGSMFGQPMKQFIVIKILRLKPEKPSSP